MVENRCHFLTAVKIRGDTGEMFEGKIMLGLRLNLWYTFNGQPVRDVAERGSGKNDYQQNLTRPDIRRAV